MRSRTLLILLVLPFFLSSCWDVTDYEHIIVEPVEVSYAFPLINSEITLMDLLEATTSDTTMVIEVRNDSIILRIRESLLYELDIALPDNLFNQTFPVIPNSTEVFYDDFTTIQNESEIKSVDFREGELWVEFEKDFVEDLDVELDLSSLVVIGEETFKVNANWSDNQFLSRHTLNLSNTHLDLFRVVGLDTLYNSLNYSVKIGETLGAGSLIMRIGFTSMEYIRIIGNIIYFEDFGTEEIDLDFFSAISGGEIHLTDPILRFNIGTSLGSPLSLLFNEIRFEKEDLAPFYLQNTSTEGNPLMINQPNYTAFATGNDPYVTTFYKLDRNNSNIDEIIPYSPNKIFFTGGYELGQIDPDLQFDYTHNFFIYDTSAVNIDLDMEIPLTGRIEDLEFSHSIEDLQFQKIEDIGNFEIEDYNITMIFRTENGIPLTFAMQVVFNDSNGVPLDTLFSNVDAENIIKSPEIDANGDPIGTYEWVTNILLPKEKYDIISDATQAELVFTINSGDETQNEVNIKASQFLKVIISVAFDAKVSPDL